jgi:hypothetical protein
MSHFILHRTNLNNNKLETDHYQSKQQTQPKMFVPHAELLGCSSSDSGDTLEGAKKKNHVGVTLFEGPELCLMSGNSSGQGRGLAA